MKTSTIFTSFFQNKSQNIEENIKLISKDINFPILFKIYQKSFISYYSSQLNIYFQNIISQNILYCQYCVNNINFPLKKCIENHNISNLIFSFDSFFQFFEDVINTEQIINQKFKHLNLAIKDFSLSQELSYSYVSQISSLIKLRLYVLIEKFKKEKNLNDINIIISSNIKLILKNLKLYDIYQNILKNFIIDEININLNPYISIHNRSIIREMIDLFNNYYLEWAYLNDTLLNNMKINNADKEIYKSKFINYIKKHFIDIKINKFFEIISNYPDSNQTIYDIKYCFSNFNKNKFINTIKNQLENRLLTPGISTRLIIEIFIRIIKIMKTIESSGYLLEKISKPIKEYLRNRKDTMQWIVTTILSEDDNNLIEDMSKAYVRNIQSLDYDYMSSDDEPENWEPIRNIKEINNTNINNNNINNNNISETKKNKSDIISTLVNVFGSPEKFMEQYKRMLSERKVTNNKFSIENEIKNLELLKIKFGENLLNSCDVIIKDIKESKKLNSNELKNNLIDCLIINKNYWPFLSNNKFEINNINPDLDINNTKFKNFLNDFKDSIASFKQKFTQKNFSRNLNFYSNVGYVNLTLFFKNGEFNFIVTPLSAMIIKMFDEENKNFFKLFNIDYIANVLQADIEDVKKSINFWVIKGVLNEVYNNNDINNNSVYYEPNENFKNVEQNEDVIIEEDINYFEYPVENSNSKLLENSILSIIRSSGAKNFEQLYKNLSVSYQFEISEIKLKDLLGKMTLEQKIFKEGENYKLIN